MEPQDVRLTDGRNATLVLYGPEEKERLVEFYASLSREALRWGLPPYDRRRIERWTTQEDSIMLLAFFEKKVIGHAFIFQQSWSERLKGNWELLIYLNQDFQEVGLGTAMMRRIIKLARERHAHRLALSVVADNVTAVKLYEKVGFQHEGLRREDYLGEDGKYHDIVEMGLLL